MVIREAKSCIWKAVSERPENTGLPHAGIADKKHR